MAYHANTPMALYFQNYELDLDFDFNDKGFLNWFHTDPQPTEQQINDTLASQAFLDWEAENGGDPTLTARKKIREALDTPTGKVLRALILELIDAGVINATPAQVATALTNRINAGEVD
jgi:hypothetical protein